MRGGSLVCTACGTETRANLAACPNCEGELRVGRAGSPPGIEERVFESLFRYDWLWKAYTVLTIIVVTSNLIGLAHSSRLTPEGTITVFLTGVVLPAVAYFVPFARRALLYWGFGPFRLSVFAFFIALYGWLELNIQVWQAIALILCYFVYLLVNWGVGDQVIVRSSPKRAS